MPNNILIQNLQNATAYDHPTKYFKVLETHISWIILTGQYAYKIKKPVNFGFLDYSTLEKRGFYCHEEVRLNQLFASALYLDVVTINGDPNKPEINGEGPILEYAIKMSEFPQENLFTELNKNNKITPELVDQLAALIAEFHHKTPVAAPGSIFGTPESVHGPVQQNFDQVSPLLSDPQDLKQLQQLEKWAQQQFSQHKTLFAQRKQQGFIRDCHGDLHLGNIILYNHKPMIFDRIEFNDDFRWTDVMADVAFLMMDLEDHQQFAYSRRFLNKYLEITGDYQGLAILPYYQAYRAMVRAKISLFRLAQPGISPQEQQAIQQKYRGLIKLATHYAFLEQQLSSQQENAITPTLFITHGLAGSGKSSLARLLVEQIGAVQISSDVERKRLFGLVAAAQTESELNKGIYDPKVTTQTYEQLAKIASTILHSGYSVIVDATFLKFSHRDLFKQLTKTMQTPFVILHCDVPREQLENWIRGRQAKQKDPSEAGLEVLDMLTAAMEPLRADEKAETITINTANVDAKQLLKQVRQHLQK